MASLIEDTEIVQGDSSDIYFLGAKDNRSLSTGWTANYSILADFGKSAIVSRALSLNSGTGEGDKYPAGTKYIFQILPTESALLVPGEKYIVTVELANPSIPFKREIVQFKVKVKPQGVL